MMGTMAQAHRRTLWELVHQARAAVGGRDGELVARYLTAWAVALSRHPERQLTAIDLRRFGLSRRGIEQGRHLFAEAFPDDADPAALLRRTGALADGEALSGASRLHELRDAVRGWRRSRGGRG
jgi:hypothetical protein